MPRASAKAAVIEVDKFRSYVKLRVKSGRRIPARGYEADALDPATDEPHRGFIELRKPAASKWLSNVRRFNTQPRVELLANQAVCSTPEGT